VVAESVPPEFTEPLTPVARYYYESELQLAQGRLATSGIRSLVADQRHNAFAYEWRGWWREVRVLQSRAESAVTFLTEWSAEETAVPDATRTAAAEAVVAEPNDDQARAAAVVLAAAEPQTASRFRLPATVKGYRSTTMRAVIIAGLALLVLDLWPFIAALYAVRRLAQCWRQRAGA